MHERKASRLICVSFDPANAHCDGVTQALMRGVAQMKLSFQRPVIMISLLVIQICHCSMYGSVELSEGTTHDNAIRVGDAAWQQEAPDN